MTSVGVIGLGLIGSALAHRLTATGDAPLVFDVKPEAVEGAVAAGAIATGSSAELAERCDVVLVCVQTDDQCIAAVCGEGGALEGAGRQLHRRALDRVAVDDREPRRDGRRAGRASRRHPGRRPRHVQRRGGHDVGDGGRRR